jgi:hypothetical protein
LSSQLFSQESDQLLFLGTSTDMCLQLARNGYGSKKTGTMTVVDSDRAGVDECRAQAQADPELAALMASGKLSFQHVDYADMAAVCRQSVFDAIVDYGGIDSLVGKGRRGGEKKSGGEGRRRGKKEESRTEKKMRGGWEKKRRKKRRSRREKKGEAEKGATPDHL